MARFSSVLGRKRTSNARDTGEIQGAIWAGYGRDMGEIWARYQLRAGTEAHLERRDPQQRPPFHLVRVRVRIRIGDRVRVGAWVRVCPTLNPNRRTVIA